MMKMGLYKEEEETKLKNLEKRMQGQLRGLEGWTGRQDPAQEHGNNLKSPRTNF